MRLLAGFQNDSKLSPYLVMRPKWYVQRPSDRIRRLVDRISRGRVIRVAELQELCDRYVRKIFGYNHGSVASSVYRGYVAVINGKWVSFIRGYVVIGRHLFRMVEKHPVQTCLWCGNPMFEPEHKKWHDHCNSRLCRELSAVKNGTHERIRLRWKWQAGKEGARTKFLAMFYIRKHQQIAKERSDAR